MRHSLLATSVGAILLSIVGCAPVRDAVVPSPSASEVVPSPTPSASEQPVELLPLSIACDQLVNDDVIYQWGNGNWAADPDYAPTAPDAARIVELGGTACGWINLTSGETLSVAAARLSQANHASIVGEISSSADSTSAFGGEGYFAATSEIGTADVFDGEIWVSATSAWFAEVGDAQPIVTAALQAAR